MSSTTSQTHEMAGHPMQEDRTVAGVSSLPCFFSPERKEQDSTRSFSTTRLRAMINNTNWLAWLPRMEKAEHIELQDVVVIGDDDERSELNKGDVHGRVSRSCTMLSAGESSTCFATGDASRSENPVQNSKLEGSSSSSSHDVDLQKTNGATGELCLGEERWQMNHKQPFCGDVGKEFEGTMTCNYVKKEDARQFNDVKKDVRKCDVMRKEDVKQSDDVEKNVRKCNDVKKDVRECNDINKEKVRQCNDVKKYIRKCNDVEKDVRKCNDVNKEKVRQCNDVRKKDVRKCNAVNKDVTKCTDVRKDVRKCSDVRKKDVRKCNVRTEDAHKYNDPRKKDWEEICYRKESSIFCHDMKKIVKASSEFEERKGIEVSPEWEEKKGIEVGSEWKEKKEIEASAEWEEVSHPVIDNMLLIGDLKKQHRMSLYDELKMVLEEEPSCCCMGKRLGASMKT